MFKVYILYSHSYDKTYAGQTSDLGERLIYHNEKGIGTFTSKFRPWVLIHEETFASRAEAMRREKWFKSGTGRILIKQLKADYLSGCGMESAEEADSSSGS